MAFAILSTAIDKNPSATSSGEITLFVDKVISLARASNFLKTMVESRFWSAFGPKTFGKKSGLSFPIITLQSVTVKGPPLR